MNIFLSYLITHHYITEEERDIYAYGLKALLLNTSSMISIYIISLLFHNPYLGFVFLLSFIPIRVYLGGYHCKTAISCFISFNVLFIIFFLVIAHFQSIPLIINILFVICLSLFPPITTSQKKHLLNRKNFIIKLCIVLFNLFILLFTHSLPIIQGITIGLSLNLLLYCIAWYQNRC